MTTGLQAGPSPTTLSGEPPRRVLISAVEPSADLHGASLIRQVSRILPGTEFAGLGGPHMERAGCRIVGDLTSNASMLLGVLGVAGRAWRLLRTLDRLMDTERFDLGLVIDSPALNLPLARRIQRRGWPVLYYIAPQTWAWAEYRNKKLARRVDRIAVILPFEEDYFRTKGIQADYVGHPLFDALENRTVDEQFIRRVRSTGRPIVTLLPGSRRQVVREVLPGQLAVCRELARRFKEAAFLLSVAGDPVRELISSLLGGSRVPIACHQDRNGELILAADLVLVASGTSTLEVAYYRTPMIVMYNHARWVYRLIGRWLITTEHLSLPNIIAGRRIVPEFMPYYRTPDPITAVAAEMLSTPHTLARITRELDDLMTPLVKAGASANTARIVAEMLGQGGRTAAKQ